MKLEYNTSENSSQYNGNIETLSRMGQIAESDDFSTIDELTYKYNGNQLKYVND